jgi:hypothetical protein
MIGRISLAACDALIARSAAHKPLIDAMRQYGLRLVPVMRGQPVASLRDIGPHPWVAIVGDDLDFSLGPSAFNTKGARRLARAARGVIVYSGAAEKGIYGAAVGVAVLTGGGTLIVETQIPHHAAWHDAVRAWAPRVPYLDVSPIGGRA